MEGSTRDRSVPVLHCSLKGAARNRSSVVFHRVVKSSVRDVSSLVVCHFFQEGAVAGDGTVVCHCSIEGTASDVSFGVVCYCSIEGSVRDRSSGVVCHCSIKDAAGNCRRRFNRTLHRLCGAEIILSTRQSQCIGAVIVTPVVALAGVFAAVGILRITILHDEVGAGDCSVQHHILARHGEFHGVFVAVVAALAVAIVDGLAVQAVDFGVGGDGHGSVFVGVGVPNRRHIVDSHDLGFGGGCIPGDGVETCYPVQTCLAVEHAASHAAVVAVVHTAREGAARDRSAVVGHFTCTTEGSARDCSFDAVLHFSIEGAVKD